jgi:hypothetical protein
MTSVLVLMLFLNSSILRIFFYSTYPPISIFIFFFCSSILRVTARGDSGDPRYNGDIGNKGEGGEIGERGDNIGEPRKESYPIN